MYSCILYDVFLSIECDLIIHIVQVSLESLKLLNGQLPLGEKEKGCINIEPVRTGIMESVDCENGTGQNGLIMPPPTAHPLTQVRHNPALPCIKE
jgi:hypothetical protein